MTELLLKIFVKNYKDTDNEKVRKSYGTFAGLAGIVLNLLLFAGKLIAGIITAAISVTADAFNNLSDAGSSIITLIGFKLAGRKEDKDHPFGHGRIEYIAGLVVSAIIIIVGFELLKSSVEKIITPEAATFSLIPFIILIASVLVKLWMGLFNRKLGRSINSAALLAVSTDSLSDVCATGAVIVGLIINAVFGINIDGYIGVIVAGFIMFSGIKSARETIKPLLGDAPDPEFVRDIRDTVCAHEGVFGVHDMIIHDYGPGRKIISLHAEVSADADINEAHDMIDLIEAEVKQKFNCDCSIHMDPIREDDERSLALKAKLRSILDEIDKRMTYHDFRYVEGPTHTNIIFDVVVPFDLKVDDEKLCEMINERLRKDGEPIFAVIEVDKDYANIINM